MSERLNYNVITEGEWDNMMHDERCAYDADAPDGTELDMDLFYETADEWDFYCGRNC